MRGSRSRRRKYGKGTRVRSVRVQDLSLFLQALAYSAPLFCSGVKEMDVLFGLLRIMNHEKVA